MSSSVSCVSQYEQRADESTSASHSRQKTCPQFVTRKSTPSSGWPASAFVLTSTPQTSSERSKASPAATNQASCARRHATHRTEVRCTALLRLTHRHQLFLRARPDSVGWDGPSSGGKGKREGGSEAIAYTLCETVAMHWLYLKSNHLPTLGPGAEIAPCD